MNLKDNKGYTLVELLIIIVFISSIAFSFWASITFVSGNFWYTEKGVEKKITLTYPDALLVVDTHRNIIDYSEITVKMKSGEFKTYYLDTSILYNYDLIQQE